MVKIIETRRSMQSMVTPNVSSCLGFVVTTEEAHYSSDTESTGFSAPTARIEVAEMRPQDSTDAKAQYLASAQNSSKRKSPLDHDHCDAKKKSSQPSRLLLCHICFDYKPVSDMFKHGKCKHQFCTLCITKHVATKIHQNILNVICPSPNCSVELEPEHFLHTILPSEVIGRWECARCESLIVASEKSYCPFKDCSVLLVNDGGEVVTSAECPSCHRLFCAQCKVPWHGNMTCEEFQANSDGKELDNKFFKLARRKNWQKCPQCTMFVQKHSGCEHMICRCGCNFCYVCGENWKFGHVCQKRRST